MSWKIVVLKGDQTGQALFRITGAVSVTKNKLFAPFEPD